MSPDAKKILLIDDEEVILFGFSRVLSGPGLQVDTARTSDEARLLVDSNAYAAALVDMRLSNSTAMEGMELIPYIKSHQSGCRIIVLTAYGEEEIVQKALRSGADLFIEKPVDPESIRLRLRQLGAV